MPKLVYSNPGVRDSVTRPVVLDIVRQVLQWTGLNVDTPIQYPGETETTFQPGSTITNEAEFNRFESHQRVHIEVTEDSQVDRILSTAVLYDDHVHIFWDGETNVFIKPSYSPTEVGITFSLRSTDQDAAMRWRDEIRTRVSMGREHRIHNATYSYIIPTELLDVLKVIHQLQENVAPYNRTYQEYFDAHKSTKIRLLSDLVGKNTTWGVGETQAGLVGGFDFEGHPEKGTKDADGSAWTISFSYKFFYDKPVATVMRYPLMVHNQLIPKEHRPTALPPRMEDNKLNYSLSSRALATFQSFRHSENKGHPGVGIPEFDEFIPAQNSVASDTLRVFTALTSIDPANPLDLLSLRELGDVKLDPILFDFLGKEAPWVTKHGQSIIHLNVYEGQFIMPNDSYELGEDLMVRLKSTPNLRSIYHVRLALFERVIELPIEAKDRLREDCRVAQMLLLALRPTLINVPKFMTCMPGNYMSREAFNCAADLINTRHDYKYNGEIYGFNTVQTLLVHSQRK